MLGAATREVDRLLEHISDHEAVGCQLCSLGIVPMPSGYALMINPDNTHYYWLRSDGRSSDIHWNRWAVYRGAKADKQARKCRR